MSAGGTSRPRGSASAGFGQLPGSDRPVLHRRGQHARHHLDPVAILKSGWPSWPLKGRMTAEDNQVLAFMAGVTATFTVQALAPQAIQGRGEHFLGGRRGAWTRPDAVLLACGAPASTPTRLSEPRVRDPPCLRKLHDAGRVRRTGRVSVQSGEHRLLQLGRRRPAVYEVTMAR